MVYSGISVIFLWVSMCFNGVLMAFDWCCYGILTVPLVPQCVDHVVGSFS